MDAQQILCMNQTCERVNTLQWPIYLRTHGLAVGLGGEVILLRRGADQLVGRNRLVALQVECSVWVGGEGIHRKLTKCVHALGERVVVHVEVGVVVLVGDRDGDRVEEAVAGALHLKRSGGWVQGRGERGECGGWSRVEARRAEGAEWWKGRESRDGGKLRGRRQEGGVRRDERGARSEKRRGRGEVT